MDGLYFVTNNSIGSLSLILTMTFTSVGSSQILWFGATPYFSISSIHLSSTIRTISKNLRRPSDDLGDHRFLSKGSRSNLSHVNRPYTSSFLILPSASHQSTPKLIIPTVSPFFAPGGRLGTASGGGSMANLNQTTCSKFAKWPGLELPSNVMAVT